MCQQYRRSAFALYEKECGSTITVVVRLKGRYSTIANLERPGRDVTVMKLEIALNVAGASIAVLNHNVRTSRHRAFIEKALQWVTDTVTTMSSGCCSEAPLLVEGMTAPGIVNKTEGLTHHHPTYIVLSALAVSAVALEVSESLSCRKFVSSSDRESNLPQFSRGIYLRELLVRISIGLNRSTLAMSGMYQNPAGQ